MSNKVTNIYIDTTGFCDEAMERVRGAISTIIDINDFDVVIPSLSMPIVGFDDKGEWVYLDSKLSPKCAEGMVGLWELESIAFRCKQEKKEEDIPTRNIYIDARNLTQEERLCAYQALGGVAFGRETGWLPDGLADGANHHEALILFDIFAIDSDGHRRFYSGDYINEIYDHLQKPKELSCEQLMSLAR